MKAVAFREFGGPEVLKLEVFPDPVAGPGEIVIEVRAVSVNRTLDITVRSGAYQRPVRLPHIPGVDPSGVIVQIGAGVSTRKIGDRVVAIPWRTAPDTPPRSVGLEEPGGYAQLVRLPAEATVLIPDALDFQTATIIGRHIGAAYTLVRDTAAIKPGEWVLVMGAAGGLGAACVQLAAKKYGARVIAAAGADARVAAALGLGAVAGVNYRAVDLIQEVLRLTGGTGVDVVIENVGDPELFEKAFLSLARQGRLVTSGAHAGGRVQLDVNRLYLYNLSLLGRTGASTADIEAGLKEAAQGGFTALVDRVFPLSQASEAHRRVEARAGVGKVLLDPQRLT